MGAAANEADDEAEAQLFAAVLPVAVVLAVDKVPEGLSRKFGAQSESSMPK